MSYTPGPLMVKDRTGCFDILSATGELVAIVHGGNKATDSANAELFAAAPELVEALAEAVKAYGGEGGPWNVPSDPGGWLGMARAALEKAGVEL